MAKRNKKYPLAKYAPTYGMMVKYLERIFSKEKMDWLRHRYIEEKIKEFEKRYGTRGEGILKCPHCKKTIRQR